jgi:hypothetical protein
MGGKAFALVKFSKKKKEPGQTEYMRIQPRKEMGHCHWWRNVQ